VRKLLVLVLLGVSTNYIVVLGLVVHDANKAYGLFRDVSALLAGATKPVSGRLPARVMVVSRASGHGVTRVSTDAPQEYLFCDCVTPRGPGAVEVVVDGTPARQFADAFIAGTLDSTPLPDGMVWTMSGWPMNSLFSLHRSNGVGPGSILTPRLMQGGILLPIKNLYGITAVMPLTPMWTGFAGNVVFWAAGWGVPLVVMPALKARRRAMAGRCTKCKYSLHGNISGICPECGTPFTSGRAAA